MGSGKGKGLGEGPGRENVGLKGEQGAPDDDSENLEGGGDGKQKGLESGGESPKSDWDGKRAGRDGEENTSNWNNE